MEEETAASAFTNCVVGRLLAVLERRYKMLKDLRRDSESMKVELHYLAAFMDDHHQVMRSRAESPTAVVRAYSELMRDLTHDMEDCIERFLHRVTCEEGASWAGRAAHWLKTVRTRLRFAAEIKQLNKRLQEAPEWVRSTVAAAGTGGQSSSRPPAASHHIEHNPAGIKKPMEHLVQLLDEPGGGIPQLRVIAIVGFRGSGKTTLASAVYESTSASLFRQRAWVDASNCTDASDLLTTIIRQACPGEDEDLRKSFNLRKSLTDYQRQ